MPEAMADAPTFQSPPISPSLETGDHDDGLATFAPVRPRLFGIAYRMLGSAAEAEDIVQDVWLRWQCANRRAVENPAAFLATTTTRLCINLLQSAQSRHETYVGTWLPEPVDTSGDPRPGAERGEALQLAVLLLLEKLSPTNARHTFCAKPSTIPTARLQTSSSWKRRIVGSLSHERVNTSRIGAAYPSVLTSREDFSRYSSAPHKGAI